MSPLNKNENNQMNKIDSLKQNDIVFLSTSMKIYYIIFLSGWFQNAFYFIYDCA